jgi:hypothetical protein
VFVISFRRLFPVLAIGVFLIGTASVESASDPVQRWEYTQFTADNNHEPEKELNLLGAQGWELVAQSSFGNYAGRTMYTFKRRIR